MIVGSMLEKSETVNQRSMKISPRHLNCLSKLAKTDEGIKMFTKNIS